MSRRDEAKRARRRRRLELRRQPRHLEAVPPPPLSARAETLLAVLGEWANEAGDLPPAASGPELARNLEVSITTYRRARDELERAGLLGWRVRRGPVRDELVPYGERWAVLYRDDDPVDPRAGWWEVAPRPSLTSAALERLGRPAPAAGLAPVRGRGDWPTP